MWRKKEWTYGCIRKACNWKRVVGKTYEMVDHLALSCPKENSKENNEENFNEDFNEDFNKDFNENFNEED
ncbi:hypothetical protein RhiirA5_409755 [Rhizophagus irregularis]|uniref:Uncharacterized protein n=1 Tax=Rhizophagus irregularis TaxID=588596 RepID=A0A2I1DZE3_9GLOM|nr:hypothetical protein RhiirA5_409755 [Rhizophagus irregularis]PKC73133.1 hypothetical protein RhiirA1_451510 [Rhizophagus irregularis]PKK79230.1 hypothetical protein RhiirC2_769361 [Rhizophagus irregularis]PKY15238.1 hypothetical protein RhiirB3_427403 [Rhizophagus irregularis]